MILSVNGGSSSLKVLLCADKEERTIATAKWDKEFARITLKTGTSKEIFKVQEGLETFQALERILYFFQEKGYIKNLKEIKKIGYRIVNGGTVFMKPTLVNEEVISKLKTIDNLSINHNPITRAIVEYGVKLLPSAIHVLCFDTDFHSTIPTIANMYGISMKYYNMGIRKYGFHGLSHKYVGEETARILNKDFSDFSGIICHLGNGSSITAIENGKSVDTTMGYTPVDGLVMGQRSGSVDPSIVRKIMEIEGVDVDRATEILSKESGFLGISGISSDCIVLLDAIEDKREGFEKANLALNLFVYQIQKYIGSYMAILSHVDAIVFTGGIGENDKVFVKRCINNKGLANLGIVLSSNEDEITSKESRIPVMQVSTNEELSIARILQQFN